MTTDRVIALHEHALDQWGGRRGPADPFPCVDGKIGSALQAEAYLEGRRAAKAGLAFVAFALRYLVLGHCFTDGNKRVAWLVAADSLASLGLGVKATDAEVVEMIEGVISHALESGEDIVDWLTPRLYAIDPF